MHMSDYFSRPWKCLHLILTFHSSPKPRDALWVVANPPPPRPSLSLPLLWAVMTHFAPKIAHTVLPSCMQAGQSVEWGKAEREKVTESVAPWTENMNVTSVICHQRCHSYTCIFDESYQTSLPELLIRNCIYFVRCRCSGCSTSQDISWPENASKIKLHPGCMLHRSMPGTVGNRIPFPQWLGTIHKWHLQKFWYLVIPSLCSQLTSTVCLK